MLPVFLPRKVKTSQDPTGVDNLLGGDKSHGLRERQAVESAGAVAELGYGVESHETRQDTAVAQRFGVFGRVKEVGGTAHGDVVLQVTAHSRQLQQGLDVFLQQMLTRPDP